MANQDIKEDDIVLCTVKRIEGTTVFLDIEDNGSGTMVFSEVSPGRIRNIREYVVPNKKIVCKVLRLKDGHPELSLRRVTGKEREEVQDRYKKAKIVINMLKTIFKLETMNIVEKIREEYYLADFLEEARDNPKLLTKYFPKDKVEEVQKLFSEKKEKEKEVREKIKLTSSESQGLEDIKNVLNTDEADISYLGSSKFAISVKADDYKTANTLMEKVIEKIKTKAKDLHVSVEHKEK